MKASHIDESAVVGASELTLHYEQMRMVARDHSALGRALLCGKGMAAWACAWRRCAPAKQTSTQSRTAERPSAPLVRELVAVLSAMAFSCLEATT